MGSAEPVGNWEALGATEISHLISLVKILLKDLCEVNLPKSFCMTGPTCGASRFLTTFCSLSSDCKAKAASTCTGSCESCSNSILIPEG